MRRIDGEIVQASVNTVFFVDSKMTVSSDTIERYKSVVIKIRVPT